ncbi:hypothetical protein CPB84DRAFT_1856058 [Gymnopilus junonius]|uniref:Uncharacterized protein n=1 Tax=Gymnopilus junonius TaxID=109634 RepID=A0A9P5N8V1_GYMJU|nr:hypothetical protein CPB84DRAFT_1856058 [Gymnopilus junonius]
MGADSPDVIKPIKPIPFFCFLIEPLHSLALFQPFSNVPQLIWSSTPSAAKSKEEEEAQTTFITELVPYYRRVKDTEHEAVFFDHLFDLWFIHWQLKASDYGGDQDLTTFVKKSKQKFLTICERRQGISSKRKCCPDDFPDNHNSKQLRPCPHPCPRRKPKSQMDAAEDVNVISENVGINMKDGDLEGEKGHKEDIVQNDERVDIEALKDNLEQETTNSVTLLRTSFGVTNDDL